MTLINEEISVLQPWVMRLPLREQGTLLTAVRGCDVAPKNPLDSLERQLVAAIRGAFMIPADSREVDSEPGCFMLSKPPYPFKASGIGHYPHHWLSHVMHASEVLAYRHPRHSTLWIGVYYELCHALHVKPESCSDFEARMLEDRIEKGNVVS